MPGLFLFLLLCFGSDALEQFQKLRRFLFDAFRGPFLEGYHFGQGRTSPWVRPRCAGHFAGNCCISAAGGFAGAESALIA
jgi:hypothetical protein